MKLYLDDERFPKTKGWVIVRSFDEFVIHIDTFGLPAEMSLDHDLGDQVPTGYDCVYWMVYTKKIDLRNIDINIHSANPVGKKNMESLINNWNNHLNREEQK
ncbi:MAG: hypothetical protein JXR36_03350 [Bacteroidales bacterium]|nr:hypothetical protein [Bacteroidales bacterium]